MKYFENPIHGAWPLSVTANIDTFNIHALFSSLAHYPQNFHAKYKKYFQFAFKKYT
jgi:hypothetical protein